MINILFRQTCVRSCMSPTPLKALPDNPDTKSNNCFLMSEFDQLQVSPCFEPCCLTPYNWQDNVPPQCSWRKYTGLWKYWNFQQEAGDFGTPRKLVTSLLRLCVALCRIHFIVGRRNSILVLPINRIYDRHDHFELFSHSKCLSV